MKKNKPFSVTTVVVSAQSSTAHIFIATIIYIMKFYNTYIQFRKKNIICHSVHIITNSNDHVVPFLNILLLTGSLHGSSSVAMDKKNILKH